MSAADDMQALAVRALDCDGPAVEFAGHWYDWSDLRRTAHGIARALSDSGADANAPVAFVPRNRPAAIAALLGLIAQGRTIRMIYAFQSPSAIARDILRLKPAAVIAAPEDMTAVVCAALRAGGIAAIAIDDQTARPLPGFEYVGAALDCAPSHERRIEILTSGTTGPPKQFPITYEMLGKHIVRANEAIALPDTNRDATPVLLYFPLGNISGLYTTLPALLRGHRAVLLDRFSVPAWHDFVVRFRPAHSGIPPASLQALLDANVPAEDMASIKTMGFGAAPLDPTVHRAFEDRYGIPVLLSYGATEFGGPVTVMNADLHAQFGVAKFGSVGRPFGGAQLRVIDAETGAELPPNHEGILEVISPRIGPDWIRTSDIALIDEDGFLFHRGRADGAIVRGGFKILPETIERALLQHPGVSAASVVGIADHRVGQAPGAVIQYAPSEQPSVAKLEAHLRELVPATHIPVEWRFVAELPKTPSMKVDRPAVLRMFDRVQSAGAHHAA